MVRGSESEIRFPRGAVIDASGTPVGVNNSRRLFLAESDWAGQNIYQTIWNQDQLVGRCE